MLNMLREEKGVATVLASLLLTAMLGIGALAIDVGNLYLNKIRLANMVDAAALAGVQDLPGSPKQASVNAYAYARQNGKNDDAVEVSIINNKVVKLEAQRNVPLFFARIFNMSAFKISAKASAAIRPISTVANVVPFGIVKQQFIYGQPYTLKEGGGSGYSGNYGALALGGNGANIYQDNIKYGYSGKLKIGDWVSTEPGNMSGPTNQGVSYRIGLDPAVNINTVQKDSQRIVIVPIIDSLSVNGRGDVQIVGFGAFFLEGTGGNGNNNYVTGTFMQMVMPGDTDASATEYGVYSSMLIE